MCNVPLLREQVDKTEHANNGSLRELEALPSILVNVKASGKKSFFPILNRNAKMVAIGTICLAAIVACAGILIYFNAKSGPLLDIKNAIDRAGQALSDAFSPQTLMILGIITGTLGLARGVYVGCYNRKLAQSHHREEGQIGDRTEFNQIT